MSAYVFYRKPHYWRDRHYLRQTLLSLTRQYDGLLLDDFMLSNLADFGWRPFEVRREVHDLVHRGLLVPARAEYRRPRESTEVAA